MDKFILLSAIAVANPDGFTVSFNDCEKITAGYSVAVESTQNSFGVEGLKNVIKYAEDHAEINAVGGWFNSENGLYYYDAVVIFQDLETAKTFGRLNKQIAIFDLNELEEITL